MKNTFQRNKVIYLICTILFIPFFWCGDFGEAMYAQKEGNTWLFSGGLGLDFNSLGSPTPIKGSPMYPFEGSATISDKQTGKLLFFTDGITVWDSSYTQMPNGNDLWGNFSSTQSAIIVPWPQNDSLFYIFTLDAQAGLVANSTGFQDSGRYAGLSYSIVNMKLNGGRGDVFVKNKGLVTPTSEKVTAVNHCNGKDLWVITHKWESDAFYTYLITSSGIDTVPIISNTGSVHTDGGGSNNNSGTLGYMKSSPNGKKLALALYSPLARVEVFDFNNSTGEVSNSITDYYSDTLQYPWNQSPYLPYGLSFSPNSQFFYVSAVKEFYQDDCDIYQYNLGAGKDSSILQSKIAIASGKPIEGLVFQAMQLAPDNKIYVWQRWNKYLGVIESPDKLGAGLQGCNYNDSAIKIRNIASGIDGFGLPSFVESFFGNTGSISLGNDFTVCDGTNIELNAGNGSTYQWSTGATSQSISISSTGTYSVAVLSGSNCIQQNGSISLQITPLEFKSYVSDTSLCGNHILQIAGSNGVSYLWSTGKTSQNIVVNTSGTYSVEVNTGKNCIINNENFNVQYHSYPVISLVTDTFICGDPLVLDAENIGSTYSWSDGNTTQTITVKTTGTYSVTVNNGYCEQSAISHIDYIPFNAHYVAPNIFTPNGDKKNDLFDLGIPEASLFDLKIFDRWGKQVFESSKNTESWTGNECDEGIYFWTLNYSVCPGQTNISKKGNVTLVR